MSVGRSSVMYSVVWIFDNIINWAVNNDITVITIYSPPPLKCTLVLTVYVPLQFVIIIFPSVKRVLTLITGFVRGITKSYKVLYLFLKNKTSYKVLYFIEGLIFF